MKKKITFLVLFIATFSLYTQAIHAQQIAFPGAEGYGRFHYQENIQYCRNARGSAYEVLDHFITGVDEDLIKDELLQECRLFVEESVKLLNGYIRYLKGKQKDQ